MTGLDAVLTCQQEIMAHGRDDVELSNPTDLSTHRGNHGEGVGAQPVKRIVGFQVSLRRVQSEQKMSSRSHESPTSVFGGMSCQDEQCSSQEHDASTLSDGCTTESTPHQVSPARSHLAEALKRSQSMPFNSNVHDTHSESISMVSKSPSGDMTRRLPRLRIQHSRRAFS